MKRTSKPTTLSAYMRSQQDKMEDRANARVVGMPVDRFKATAQAKEIDRQIVSLNKMKAAKK